MTRMRLLASMTATLLLFTACGGDDASNSGEVSGSGDTATLSVSTTDLGDVLVDGEGYALYMFGKDQQNAGTSACEGDCLANWPALGAVQAGDGVDAALIGSIERSDGSTQATYDGWPLYYFANDVAAGETNGQAVNDVWFVVSPDGTPVGMSG